MYFYCTLSNARKKLFLNGHVLSHRNAVHFIVDKFNGQITYLCNLICWAVFVSALHFFRNFSSFNIIFFLFSVVKILCIEELSWLPVTKIGIILNYSSFYVKPWPLHKEEEMKGTFFLISFKLTMELKELQLCVRHLWDKKVYCSWTLLPEWASTWIAPTPKIIRLKGLRSYPIIYSCC